MYSWVNLLPLENENFVLGLSPFFMYVANHMKTEHKNSLLAISLIEQITFENLALYWYI